MIFFREADLSCAVEGKKTVSAWLKSVVKSHGKILGEICIVSCSDNHLLEVNKKHLNHDYFTDIITFDYSEGNKVSGDLLISFDRVKENAALCGVGFQEELRRVMVHGCLHLCGFGDKTDGEKQAMRQEENKALKLFHVEPE